MSNPALFKTLSALKKYTDKLYRHKKLTEAQHRELNNLMACGLPLRLIINKCKEFNIL